MWDWWSSDADIDIGSRSYRVEPGMRSSRCVGRVGGGAKKSFYRPGVVPTWKPRQTGSLVKDGR